MAESFREYLQSLARGVSGSVDEWRKENIDPITSTMQQSADRLQAGADEFAPQARQAIMDHGGQFVRDNPYVAPVIGGAVAAAPLIPAAAASPMGVMATTTIGLHADRLNNFIKAVERHPLYRMTTGGPMSTPKAKQTSLMNKAIDFIERGKSPAGKMGKIFNDVRNELEKYMRENPGKAATMGYDLPMPVAAPPSAFKI